MSKIYAHIPGINRPGKRIKFKVEESKPEIGDYYGRVEVVKVEDFRADIEDKDAGEYDLYKITTFDQSQFDKLPPHARDFSHELGGSGFRFYTVYGTIDL